MRAYEKHVATCALAARPPRWPLGARYALCVHVAKDTRADLDNVLKGIADSLTGICWKDDRQVEDWSIIRDEDPFGGIHVTAMVIE